jgi:hypothetical protein
VPLPESIANAPELELGLELFFSAFWDLTTCRPSGWSVQPIPWSAIIEWGQMHELDYEEMDDLLFYVREMDSEFIDYVAEQNSKKK